LRLRRSLVDWYQNFEVSVSIVFLRTGSHWTEVHSRSVMQEADTTGGPAFPVVVSQPRGTIWFAVEILRKNSVCVLFDPLTIVVKFFPRRRDRSGSTDSWESRCLYSDVSPSSFVKVIGHTEPGAHRREASI